MDVTSARPVARRFRLRFWVVLLGVLVASQLLMLAFSAAIWVLSDGRQAFLFLDMNASGWLKWLVLLVFLAVTAWAGWRVRVDPVGFDTSKMWDSVPWDAVQGAELCRLFGLPYVRLTVKAHGTVRVPLVLQDIRGFVAAVGEFAGRDHPLTRLLCEWMDDSE